jgi:ERF superfamily protein
MQRSNHNIGALAAALARAQCELQNPEKSATGVLPSTAVNATGSRSFRYAPLSAGLDIIRKCLGKQEIATVQATAFDQQPGLVTLTTTLVHASGEWVSSDWPVCPVSDTADPQRMGAALTYARRYALFALVGIAGEDDLDAPDNEIAGQQRFPYAASARRPGKETPVPDARKADVGGTAELPPDRSAALRMQIIKELEAATDEDALTAWADKALHSKSQLVRSDAEQIETAFAAKARQLAPSDFPSATPAEPGAEAATVVSSSKRCGPQRRPASTSSAELNGRAVTAIPKRLRLRDKDHLKFVATQSCLICGRTPADPHHLRFAEQPGLGSKVSDEFTVPLCRMHHRQVHWHGNERTWWEQQRLDPLPITAALWSKSRLRCEGASNSAENTDTPAPAHEPTTSTSYETNPIRGRPAS